MSTNDIPQWAKEAREALQECSTQLWHAIEAKEYEGTNLQFAMKRAKKKADDALTSLPLAKHAPADADGADRDVARLDWLESQGRDVLCHRPAYDDTDQRKVFWVRGYLDGTPRTLREAIDAARRSALGGKE
jgi:hypothetical protein